MDATIDICFVALRKSTPTSAWVRANIRHVVEVLGHADIARDIPN
jgi:hypothetical protein